MSSRTSSRDASPSVGADGKKKGGFLQRFERALGLGDDHPQSDYDSSSFHKSGVADSTHSSKAASNAAVKPSSVPGYASPQSRSTVSTPTATGATTSTGTGSYNNVGGSRATPGAPIIAGSDKPVNHSNSRIDAETGTSPMKEVGAALGASDVRATRQGDVLQREYEQDEAASKHVTKPHTKESSNDHTAAKTAGVVGAIGVADKLDHKDNSRQQQPISTQQPMTNTTTTTPVTRTTPAAIDSNDYSRSSAPVSNYNQSSSGSHLGRDAAIGAGAGALAADAGRHHNERNTAQDSSSSNRAYTPSNVSQKPTSNPVASNAPDQFEAENTPFTSGLSSNSSNTGRDAAAGAGLGALATQSPDSSRAAAPSTPVAPRSSNTTAGAPIASKIDNNTSGGFGTGNSGFNTVQPRVIGTSGTAADKFHEYTHVGTAHVDCDDLHIKHGRFANWRPRDQNTTGSNSGY